MLVHRRIAALQDGRGDMRHPAQPKYFNDENGAQALLRAMEERRDVESRDVGVRWILRVQAAVNVAFRPLVAPATCFFPSANSTGAVAQPVPARHALLCRSGTFVVHARLERAHARV